MKRQNAFEKWYERKFANGAYMYSPFPEAEAIAKEAWKAAYRAGLRAGRKQKTP